LTALMHLALTGLGELVGSDEAAWRLSTTERLIEDGVDPRFISRTLGLDGTVRGEVVSKYSQDQPRVSAGNAEGGQWSNGSRQGRASSPRPARDTGVQVADASENWAQYVKPSAESDRQRADIDASPQPSPQAPAKGLTIVHEVPADAVSLTAGDGTSFYAPPYADFSKVYAAGQANWQNPVAAYFALTHFGPYDFQRDSGNFYSAYTNASNYGVGVYMAGAGYSYDATIALCTFVANRISSNSGANSQSIWWTKGWNDATNGTGPLHR
jgi:hypothetical protein